jgi:hypothetical protein
LHVVVVVVLLFFSSACIYASRKERKTVTMVILFSCILQSGLTLAAKDYTMNWLKKININREVTNRGED